MRWPPVDRAGCRLTDAWLHGAALWAPPAGAPKDSACRRGSFHGASRIWRAPPSNRPRWCIAGRPPARRCVFHRWCECASTTRNAGKPVCSCSPLLSPSRIAALAVAKKRRVARLLLFLPARIFLVQGDRGADSSVSGGQVYAVR